MNASRLLGTVGGGILALCALGFALACYIGQRRSGQRAMAILAAMLNIFLMAGALPLVSRFGPLVLVEALLLLFAVDIALVGGLWMGRRRAEGASVFAPTGALLILTLLDIYGFYSVNRRVVDIAQQLGIGKQSVRYEPRADLDCPENLKKLYTAFAKYVDDNHSLPSADRWMENEDLTGFIQKNEWLHCPAVSNRSDDRYGYAYNEGVAGKKTSGALKDLPDAARTPLLYDSDNLGRSAHDRFASLPVPGRHQNKNYILYCDGHIEMQ